MNEINVSRLIDTSKLRPYHFWLTFWCLLAIMADGFDLLNASIAGPALIKEWNISRASLGPVFSASFFGFFLGAPFFGYLGDRYGRKLAIILSLIFLGLATFACAFATDLHELLGLRFLSGIGLGGVIPNVIALNSEFAPKRLRATFLVVISMGISLGGSIPGIVGVTLMPTYGWPVIFIVGGVVPIVVGLLMIFAVPESIKFLVLRGGRDVMVRRLIRRIDPDLTVAPDTRFVLDPDEGAKTRGSVIELFRGGWAVVTILVWLIFVLNLMSNNLLNAWLPMIVQTSGHSAEQGAYAGTLYQLGGSFGGLLIGVFIDRIGLKVFAVVFAIAVPVVALHRNCRVLSSALLLSMAFLSGCVVTGMQNALNAGAGLIYPTWLARPMVWATRSGSGALVRSAGL